MDTRIRMAAQLLVDQEYDIAKTMLEKQKENPQVAYWLSLLHRYHDDYEQEKTLLDRVSIFNKSYAQERLAWHNLPIFDRLVPRQPLDIILNPDEAPPQNILEQLCFVTASGPDYPYWELCINLIESVRNTKKYKNIPVAIIDCGLSDEQKHFLITTYGNLTIKDPGWDFEIHEKLERGPNHFVSLHDGIKACTARPFIDKHFPGFRYYFWLDTDMWIQNEQILDLLINNCVTIGCGFLADQCEQWLGSPWNRRLANVKIIPDDFNQKLINQPLMTAATFCVDAQSSFFPDWRENCNTTYRECGYKWGFDELTFVYTAALYFQKNRPLFLKSKPYQINGFGGLPIIKNGNPQILYMPDTQEIIGSVHLTAADHVKKYPIMPMLDLKDGQHLSAAQVEENRRLFYYVAYEVDHTRENLQDLFPRHKMVPYHYRTWPWADKPEILDRLMQEAKSVLES